MTSDGRLLKGKRRRRLVLDATMRVVGRSGVAAVSQRVVAAEAGVAASVVTYYFPTIDDLLVGALTDINDRCLQALDECAADPDPLAALARLIASGADPASAARAEYELFFVAARNPVWRTEYQRWVDGLDRFLARFVGDPVRLSTASAAVDGLMVRACSLPEPPGIDDVHALLVAVAGNRSS